MAESIIKMTEGVIRQQKNTILKNVNIDIKSGDFIYLIGKVGSGKSSFLKTLYAELPFEFGDAEVAGFQLKKIKKSQIPLLRRKCGIVFQDFKLLIDRNVYENLEFVLRATGWKNKQAIKERIETVLAKVEMSDKQKQMPHELSGGEQQRIVLARALLNAPPLILADEPTGNIDPETSYRLIELLKEICDMGKTIVIATHQYDLIEKYPGRVFCCENGELHERLQSSDNACVVATDPDLCASPETEEVVPSTEEVEESSDIVEEMPVEEFTEQPQLEAEDSKKAEQITPEVEGIDIIEEDKLPQFSENEPKDIYSLLGKLDYPEITSFDYEIEKRPTTVEQESRPDEESEAPVTPEIKEEKKQDTLPSFDLELID